MSSWILYIILIIIMVSAVIIRRDTKELIRRSDEIQKSLNKFIVQERKHNAR